MVYSLIKFCVSDLFLANFVHQIRSYYCLQVIKTHADLMRSIEVYVSFDLNFGAVLLWYHFTIYGCGTRMRTNNEKLTCKPG